MENKGAGILVTGGTGVMGRRLVDAFVQQGKKVKVLALPGDTFLGKWDKDKIELAYGDVTDINSLTGLMDGVDTVLHLAAVILTPASSEIFKSVNVEGTRNLVRLSEEADVKHFIYLSSASVTYVRTNAYSRSKAAAEKVIQKSGLAAYTIVRPTLVYQDDGEGEFAKFTAALKKYPFVPFIGSGKAVKSPVYVDDVIQGLLSITGNPLCFGKTYNFSGGESLTLRDLARRLLNFMGSSKPILPLPIWVCRVLAFFIPLIFPGLIKTLPFNWQTITGFIEDANLDSSQATQDISYTARPFSEGIQELKSIEGCLG